MATYDANDDPHDPDKELQDLTPYKDPNRPYSIDLALELEHQLGNDSVPPPDSSHRESLDPHILASIVMQLRHNLAELTKERDTLQHMLSYSTSQAADLKESMQLMAEKCEKMAYELEQARAQNHDDANAIAMLRSKVEESRRGLMKLQAEAKHSRRQSVQAPIVLDMSRVGIPSGQPSSKRASFTPLAGSHVRPPPRGASVSVSDPVIFGLTPGAIDGLPDSSPPDQPRSSLDNDANGTSQSLPSSRAFSSLFGRTSPQPHAGVEQSPPRNDVAAQLEALKRELRSVKDELEETRHELIESNEAREASETCVKALREFIGENHGDRMRLPPTPHMAKGEEADETADLSKKNGLTGGWGFKLWPGGNGSGPVKASTSSYTQLPVRRGSNAPVPSPRPSASQPPPAFGRLGGFFSSRADSISSVNSPNLQNGSDTSSETEPVSPTMEASQTNVLVRENNLTGEASSTHLSGIPSEEEAKGIGVQILAQ